MVSWWFKSFAGQKIIVLNALPAVVYHGQCIMLKTSSLFVHNQEDRRHSHCSVRQKACVAHIFRSSVHNIIKKDFQIGLNLMFSFCCFFRLSCMTKNENFAQTLLHTVKQWYKIGVVENFYTVDVLTVYCTYLPKNLKVALNLPKLL